MSAATRRRRCADPAELGDGDRPAERERRYRGGILGLGVAGLGARALGRLGVANCRAGARAVVLELMAALHLLVDGGAAIAEAVSVTGAHFLDTSEEGDAGTVIEFLDNRL